MLGYATGKTFVDVAGRWVVMIRFGQIAGAFAVQAFAPGVFRVALENGAAVRSKGQVFAAAAAAAVDMAVSGLFGQRSGRGSGLRADRRMRLQLAEVSKY